MTAMTYWVALTAVFIGLNLATGNTVWSVLALVWAVLALGCAIGFRDSRRQRR